MMSFVYYKLNSPGNVKCLINAYMIAFGQAEEHTGLTDEEEKEDSEEEENMKTEIIKHYSVTV